MVLRGSVKTSYSLKLIHNHRCGLADCSSDVVSWSKICGKHHIYWKTSHLLYIVSQYMLGMDITKISLEFFSLTAAPKVRLFCWCLKCQYAHRVKVFYLSSIFHKTGYSVAAPQKLASFSSAYIR